MPRDLVQHVFRTLSDLGVPRDACIVVGVSGGADSMALLLLLHAARYDVRVVHVHHGLRHTAEDDAAFVGRWCQEQDVPFEVIRLEGVLLRESDRGVQAAARDGRYAALTAAAHRHGARWVAVGHHVEDQIETMLMRLARGVGPDRAIGMESMRVLGADSSQEDLVLVRPLLQCVKSELAAFLRRVGQDWIEDPGNADRLTPRGRLRHTVLPALREAIGEGRLRTMARSGMLRGAAEPGVVAKPRDQLDPDRSTYWPRLTGYWPLTDGVPGARALRTWLATLSATADPSAKLSARILALFEAEVGTHVPWAGLVVWRERNGIAVLRSTEKSPTAAVSLASSLIETHQMHHDDLPERLGEVPPDAVFIDADVVPLADATVRPWRVGERVHLANAPRASRIAALLSQRVVPVSHRPWVRVVEIAGHIVAVPGVGAAHRARITPATTRVVRLTVPPVPRL